MEEKGGAQLRGYDINQGERKWLAQVGEKGIENGPKVSSPEWPLTREVNTAEGTGLGIVRNLILNIGH